MSPMYPVCTNQPDNSQQEPTSARGVSRRVRPRLQLPKSLNGLDGIDLVLANDPDTRFVFASHNDVRSNEPPPEHAHQDPDEL